MIAIIRIKGLIDIPKDEEETMRRLRLGKKFSCVVVNENKETLGMVKKIRNYVAYGKIDDSMLIELIEKRGKVIGDKKIDASKSKDFDGTQKSKISDVKKVIGEIEKGKIESIKPFFRLHPPRGGIESKKHYPKGVLGKNEKINELIKRML